MVRQLVLSLTWQAPSPEGPAIALLMSGLPGTGKTCVSRWLAERLPAIVVGSDFVRKSIYPCPAYTQDENEITHHICHAVMRELLAQGHSVIYDATNLVEAHRRLVYRLADDVGAQLLVIRTTAPEEEVRRRLWQRQVCRAKGDLSDADWDVYRMLQASSDAVFAREVMTVNTCGDLVPALERVLSAIAALRLSSS